MRQFCVTLVLCVMCQAAAPAYAMSWWNIERLSGPQFGGPAAELRVYCWTDNPDEDKPQTDTEASAAKPEDTRVARSVILSLCKYEKPRRRLGSADINFAFLQSDPDPLFANGEAVNLVVLGVSASRRVFRASWVPIEVGFGTSVGWFSSKGIRSFDTLVLDGRVDVRPMDIWNPHDWWQQMLVLRVGLVSFPRGLTSAEFNTTRPLHDGAVRYWSISVDTEPLFRFLRQP